MNRHEPIENDDLLAQRLRGEARRDRPAFSLALHTRIMSAVCAAPLPETSAKVRAPRTARGHFVSWVVAALASIATTAALAFFWHNLGPAHDIISHETIVQKTPLNAGVGNPESIPPEGDTGNSDLDSAADDVATTASGIGDWVQSAADDSQWAGLDRDAQAALSTIAGPLPFDLTISVAASEPTGP